MVTSINAGKVGFGLAGLTINPSAKLSQDEFNKLLKSVIDNRGHHEPLFLNSGEFYGMPNPHENIQKLGAFFKGYPNYADQVFVSVKGGIVKGGWDPDVSTDNLKRTLEDINRNLDPLYRGRKKLPARLDLFTLARVGDRPIEETVKDLKELQNQGLFSGICLSEVGVNTIRRASKVADIAAAEIEFSLFVPDAAQNGVFSVLKELNIPAICYSPLGMGLLTDSASEKIGSTGGPAGTLDRFKEETWRHNQQLLKSVQEIAAKIGITSAKLALSYIATISNTGTYPHLLPIPGAVVADQQIDNLHVVELPPNIVDEIDNVLRAFKRQGLRYSASEESRLWN